MNLRTLRRVALRTVGASAVVASSILAATAEPARADVCVSYGFSESYCDVYPIDDPTDLDPFFGPTYDPFDPIYDPYYDPYCCYVPPPPPEPDPLPLPPIPAPEVPPLPPAPPPPPPGTYSLPLPGGSIPRPINNHHTYPAIDIPVPQGTPVTVMEGGIAFHVDQERCGLGVQVNAGNRKWVYCHLSRRDVVNGGRVATGEQIGASGNTGTSDGPHLHVQIKIGDVKYCPQPLIDAVLDGRPAPAVESLPTSGCVGQGPYEPDVEVTEDDIAPFVVPRFIPGVYPFPIPRLPEHDNR